MTDKEPTAPLGPLLGASDILNHAVRLANLIEMASESLQDEAHAAISTGTNALIDKIRKADEILEKHHANEGVASWPAA